MLNLVETILLYRLYRTQKDIYLRSSLISLTVFLFVDVLRGQVAEVNLLQLIPGLYIGLIFCSFLVLTFLTFYIFQIPIKSDSEKKGGTKTIDRILLKTKLKSNLSFFIIGFYFMISIILPLSLDSFNSYGEKNLESFWSFDDLNNIETSLIILLFNIFQGPINITSSWYIEKQLSLFPFFLRDYTFYLSIFAGVLTPTVDISTQASFISVGLNLYFLVFSILKKYTSRFIFK